jgi:hypothetical protein
MQTLQKVKKSQFEVNEFISFLDKKYIFDLLHVFKYCNKIPKKGFEK